MRQKTVNGIAGCDRLLKKPLEDRRATTEAYLGGTRSEATERNEAYEDFSSGLLNNLIERVFYNTHSAVAYQQRDQIPDFGFFEHALD